MKSALFLSVLALASGLLIPSSSYGRQATTATATAPDTTKKTYAPKAKNTIAPKAPPSSQEIADAKGKGMVWVNTSTHVYHKDGESYGTTKRGKFMTEDDAKKAGFRIAKEPGSAKAAKAAAK